ncbi:MAG: DNA mismatch repair protein MutS [Firmicutes bacterium]|nr:DNA mismatch repair protein MutS [Bacillota bacterium]
MAEYSPMMQQYLSVKEQYKNCILFYRLGDFYEMFFDDAKLVAKELELTLTGRGCGQEERAPMCGVPYHSAESYIARLIAKGYKVAICEQMEDPATAKGLVRRDIVRVVTPGTILEGSMLDETRNNYIASVYLAESRCGVCFADISTGEVYGTELLLPEGECASLRDELARYQPKELLFNGAVMQFSEIGAFCRERLHASGELLDDERFDRAACRERVLRQFEKDDLPALSLTEESNIVPALGALLGYLEETQRTGIERINSLSLYSQAQYMRLDLSARRNLELTETMRSKEKRGTLLWVLDRTQTAMGKRLIRAWIERPLMHCAHILRRHDAVEELVNDPILRETVRSQLAGIFDLERLMTRVVYGSAGGRELRSLCATAQKLPDLREALEPVKCSLLTELLREIDPLEDLCELVDRAIVEDPPVSVREGGIIREGYHAELDALRSDMTDGKGFIARIEAQEKERTGIRTLKVGYNRVFGYYIEVSNSFKDSVPPEYIRKQTLTNGERYITPELKQLESRILGAQERSVQMEYQLFDEVRRTVAAELERIQKTAQAIAQLDVLVSFAETASAQNYCRPQMNLDGRIVLKNSRHPVVEALSEAPFVPNDVLLDQNENRVAIITGPNMAGKSTYMRQTALICLMAQCGSFVPAQSAELGIVDGIYTRVGASDDLSSGQSTFMVEMSEVADILHSATKDSLLILDEIGRGTSTYDGMSIARAVLEYVADKRRLGVKTMFATHYHELTAMEETIGGVKNYNIAVKKHGDEITFLRRIVRGGADDSFGIEVAKLAGVPEPVIRRAKKILKEMETEGTAAGQKRPRSGEPGTDDGQLTMIPAAQTEILETLKSLDPNVLSPIEAMNTLFGLWQKAQKL